MTPLEIMKNEWPEGAEGALERQIFIEIIDKIINIDKIKVWPSYSVSVYIFIHKFSIYLEQELIIIDHSRILDCEEFVDTKTFQLADPRCLDKVIMWVNNGK